MIRSGRIVSPALLALIGVVTYALLTFERAELRPPRQGPGRLADPAALDVSPQPARTVEELNYCTTSPFRTIIELPPPPPPPPPRKPEPPKLREVMSQFQMVMPLAPTVLLLDKKTRSHVEWRVGENRTILWRNRPLDVTLRRVDEGDFSVHFTAPKEQSFVFRLGDSN